MLFKFTKILICLPILLLILHIKCDTAMYLAKKKPKTKKNMQKIRYYHFQLYYDILQNGSKLLPD